MALHMVSSHGLIPAEHLAGARSATLDVPARSTGQMVKSAALEAGYRKLSFEAGERGSFAGERRSEAMYIKIPDVTLLVHWAPNDPDSSVVEWVAYRQEAGLTPYPDPAGMTLFETHLRQATSRWTPSVPQLAKDPVVPPGELPPVRYQGHMRDYSALATDYQLQKLRQGVLPLGYSAFGLGEKAIHGAQLYMPKVGSVPGEELGVLISALSNAGRTQFLERWAAAAIVDGRSVFVVDGRGNLRRELDKRLTIADCKTELLEFSSASGGTSDRFNLLRGISAGKSDCAEQLRDLAAVLIPAGLFQGENEFLHQITVQIAVACLKLLKLLEWYGPENFRDPEGRLRPVDLCDLLELVERESYVMQVIDWIRAQETLERKGAKPQFGVEECVGSLALALGMTYPSLPGKKAGEADQRFRGGRRPVEQTYMQWMNLLMNALEPFRSDGVMGPRVRSFGAGQELLLEEFGLDGAPVSLVLTVTEENPVLAESVMGMALRRLVTVLAERKKKEEPLGAVLVLLPDAARIPGFDAREWAAAMRDNRVGYALAYRELGMISKDPNAVRAVVSAAGTLVFLDGLNETDLEHLNRQMNNRRREREVSSLEATSGVTLEVETVPLLEEGTASPLPGGEHPALVYVRNTAPPFLVDRIESLELAGQASE